MASESCKQLHKVQKDELPVLYSWLTSHLPYSWRICSEVKEHLAGTWHGLTFYTLGWPEILAVAEGGVEDTCQLKEYYSHSLRSTSVFSTSAQDARKILTYPGFVDWTKPIKFFSIDHRLSETIVSLCREMTGETVIHKPCYLMVAEEGTLTDCPECPEGMSIRDMDVDKDGEFAVANWPHAGPGSEGYMRALVGAYRSVALVDKDDRCIGYEMSTEYGTMGMLFVSEAYRGRALGKLITHRMARHTWKRGLPAAVTVITENTNSVRLHERMGFKTLCVVDWIINRPKKKIIADAAAADTNTAAASDN